MYALIQFRLAVVKQMPALASAFAIAAEFGAVEEHLD
jgi:hypothetical protein